MLMGLVARARRRLADLTQSRAATTWSRVPVQSLWIGPELSTLERLSLTSFVQNGHRVHLYIYDDVAGIPPGVVRRDARKILPADRIFRYGPEAGEGEGSVAAFANVFRYKLLSDRGGWWFDTDVVCLRPLDVREPYCFAREDETGIAIGLIKAPRNSSLMKTLYDSAVASGTELVWADTGPTLMTRVVAGSSYERFVLPPQAVYPVSWRVPLSAFEEDPLGIVWAQLEGAYTVHLWNELLRRAGLDKNARFPATSVFERLKRRYGFD
ncbi:MAG: hypothetical protein E6G60_01690 [Actinobacteria bacterium]|nr:MAG: hypothetical protein E6G60_01690 [Actinomycetota bacterium]